MRAFTIVETALVLVIASSVAAQDADVRDLTRPARAAIFRAPGFPTIDAPPLSEALLTEALNGLPVTTLGSVEELRQRLRLRDFDALVLPYGSAFPLDAWWELRTFVKRGGSLVVLGGAPFHQPVLRTNDGWRLGTRQPTFAHEFLIGPAEAVTVSPDWNEAPTDSSWLKPVIGARTVWELTVRFGTKPDTPQESGSEAHRDAVLRPLLLFIDERDLPRACPLLEIDRLRGEEAGGRWIFATSDAPLTAAFVRALVQRALAGASELDAGPVHASVQPGETPLVRVVMRRPVVREGDGIASRAELVVREDAGREVHRTSIELTGEPGLRQGTAAIETNAPLAPGLYRVEVTIGVGGGAGLQPARTERAGSPLPISTTTGFWIHDAALLSRGPRITVSRDWLRRDGEVFPVIGTTYMASDVHRKFLFEPDPHVWNRDFAQMSRLGINFVRTGIWTGWSRVMLNPGVVDEAVLRALDAYVQTAAKHGIVVNFTFFAFLPPAFGGVNPYLDPRSLEGQRELLTAVARRYRGVQWIHYDLINEPSYAPPEGLWSNRPIRDPLEKKAWLEWIRRNHGEDAALLRSRWQDRAWDVFELPWDHELWYAQIRENRRPRKVRDFVVFSNEIVTGWARQLRDILRAAGGDPLVTLGQDEGGIGTRPSQQLHAEAVDYTGIHPWWQNDDVLSTGVFTKVPEKPNLFQETGLMRLEDTDGWPVRSPELAANVLESKYAYAFASRAAGVIEWAWNINPYMAIDNESVIGFLRPDGTAKPELEIVPEYAAFFEKARPWLDDFEPDPVVIVIPHSRLFAARPAAMDGYRRAVRVLAERFGVVPTALSELRLTPERLRDAKLVFVPSPEMLDRAAADALLAASRAGSKILVTGAVTGDAYGESTPALEALGIVDRGRPVRLREATRWGVATFDRNLREHLLRSTLSASLNGNVWHEPLPLEHAREDEPLAALLEHALRASGVPTHPSSDPIAARVLAMPRALLAVVVNETARDAQRRVTIAGRAVNISVAAGRAKLVLFERATGRILAETR